MDIAVWLRSLGLGVPIMQGATAKYATPAKPWAAATGPARGL
jgi:hypothetical protein